MVSSIIVARDCEPWCNGKEAANASQCGYRERYSLATPAAINVYGGPNSSLLPRVTVTMEKSRLVLLLKNCDACYPNFRIQMSHVSGPAFSSDMGWVVSFNASLICPWW
jgi:hypothetical protein